jgi:hypothetical protein
LEAAIIASEDLQPRDMRAKIFATLPGGGKTFFAPFFAPLFALD